MKEGRKEGKKESAAESAYYSVGRRQAQPDASPRGKKGLDFPRNKNAKALTVRGGERGERGDNSPLCMRSRL